MVSSKRVLIVEDEFFVALDLELLVHKQAPAAQVVVCATVTEARKATREPVGLALLDIDVLDGKTFEIAHSLKQQNIPVILVSESKQEEIPQDLADVPFIPKPFAAPTSASEFGSLVTGSGWSRLEDEAMNSLLLVAVSRWVPFLPRAQLSTSSSA